MTNDRDITGKYRHYKGGEYEVIGEATHTEAGERLVLYKALYEPSTLWARPYDMFFETIIIDGINRLRFESIER